MGFDEYSRAPWRGLPVHHPGQSCLPCRDSSRHFFADARDSSFQKRKVGTTADAAGKTAPDGARASRATPRMEPEAL
jgi:hypothetical protein